VHHDRHSLGFPLEPDKQVCRPSVISQLLVATPRRTAGAGAIGQVPLTARRMRRPPCAVLRSNNPIQLRPTPDAYVSKRMPTEQSILKARFLVGGQAGANFLRWRLTLAKGATLVLWPSRPSRFRGMGLAEPAHERRHLPNLCSSSQRGSAFGVLNIGLFAHSTE
jgi:hypothetical protein